MENNDNEWLGVLSNKDRFAERRLSRLTNSNDEEKHLKGLMKGIDQTKKTISEQGIKAHEVYNVGWGKSKARDELLAEGLIASAKADLQIVELVQESIKFFLYCFDYVDGRLISLGDEHSNSEDTRKKQEDVVIKLIRSGDTNITEETQQYLETIYRDVNERGSRNAEKHSQTDAKIVELDRCSSGNSEAIDQLSRTLDNVQDEVLHHRQALQSDITKTVASFKDEVQEQHQALTAKLETTNKTVATVKDEVQEQNQALTAKLETTNKTVASFKDDVQEQHQALTAKLETTDKTVASFKDEVQEKHQALTAKLETTNKTVASFKDEVQEKHQALTAKLEAEVSKVADEMQGFTALNATAIEDMKRVEAMEQTFATTTKKLQKVIVVLTATSVASIGLALFSLMKSLGVF